MVRGAITGEDKWGSEQDKSAEIARASSSEMAGGRAWMMAGLMAGLAKAFVSSRLAKSK